MHSTIGPGQGIDPGLLSAAVGGSERAFDALIGPLVEPGYRVALTMLRSPQEAEDAVQEAVFKAWRGLSKLKEGAALRPWFFAILANQCRSMMRRGWRAILPLPETAPARGRELEDVVIQSADLAAAFRRLPAEDRLAMP
jgi:RNA polymerase sigma-70 factor (ECF subfamily)